MNRPARNRRVSSLPGAASNPLTPPGTARHAFRISIALHLGLVLALLLGSLCAKGCASTKKEPEELIFVDFTVSAPPPPPAEATPDEPEPPPPEPVPDPLPPPPEPAPIPEPVPEPQPEPKPPEPPKEKPKKHQVVRQTNLVTRTFNGAPPPKDKPMSAAEIEKALKAGARLSDRTSIPTDSSQLQLGAYFNHVHERLYAAWSQPPGLSDFPGMSCEAEIVVQPDGRISSHSLVRPSGNTQMDESVKKALSSVPRLKPLPPGFKNATRITITFNLD